MNALSKAANRKIGQAMHNYSMLADGDRVLIAVSGGVDSLVLTWVLNYWQHKAPIHYDLLAVCVDNGFDTSTGDNVAKQLRQISVPYLIKKTNHRFIGDIPETLFHICARIVSFVHRFFSLPGTGSVKIFKY